MKPVCDCPLQGQEFKFMCWIFSFCLALDSTSISYYPIFAIFMSLIQHCSQTKTTRICGALRVYCSLRRPKQELKCTIPLILKRTPHKYYPSLWDVSFLLEYSLEVNLSKGWAICAYPLRNLL